jgi:hypothetical protein
MIEKLILSKLGYGLLSIIASGKEEPLSVLCRDFKRLENATIDETINTLLEIVDLGFAKCFYVINEAGNWEPVEKPTFDNFKKRYETYTNFEREEYPESGDYWFVITKSGSLEIEKLIYKAVYVHNLRLKPENT